MSARRAVVECVSKPFALCDRPLLLLVDRPQHLAEPVASPYGRREDLRALVSFTYIYIIVVSLMIFDGKLEGVERAQKSAPFVVESIGPLGLGDKGCACLRIFIGRHCPIFRLGRCLSAIEVVRRA